MYLKNNLIRFLKVKNILMIIAGVFFVAASVSIIMELTVYYFGDWNTILHARAMPESIGYILLGSALIIISRVSKRLINDARFFSGYFEGDLNGYVDYSELAEVTGRTPAQVRRRLRLIRPLYMKNYRFISADNTYGGEIIELYSKTVTCSCRSCGALMEKRIYFTGECPYCGSCDLTARVVSGERFYYISDNAPRPVNEPAYYLGRSLKKKEIGLLIGLVLAVVLTSLMLLVFAGMIAQYNDQEYLTKKLLSGTSYSSVELIKKELMNTIIFSAYAAAAFASAIPIVTVHLVDLYRAKRYAQFFSSIPTPFVEVSALSRTGSKDPVRELKGVVKAIRDGYLRGCSPEKHGGPLRIGLAKQIVKDRCPGCGAPIVGAVDENACCRYCGRLILGVVQKR